MMFTSGCSIFATDAVYYYVTTRWVIVLILLQSLKNAFRHVQSIRNKSPSGQHRGFFGCCFFFISNFQNNMFLMKCSRSTNSLKDWWPLKLPKHSQWGWLLLEIRTVLEKDFFRSHEKEHYVLKILSTLWDYEVSGGHTLFFPPPFLSFIFFSTSILYILCIFCIYCIFFQ